MNLVDLGVIVAIAAATLGGLRTGLVSRLAAWIGMIAGVGVAVLAAPSVLAWVPSTDARTRFTVVFGVSVLLLVLTTGLMSALGERLRRRLHRRRLLLRVDRLAGGIAAATMLAVLLWLLTPVAAAVPGTLALQVRTSVLLSALHERAPEPPDAVAVARRLVDTSGFPTVLADLESAPVLAPPPASVGVPATVLATVGASTVRVETTGCGRRSSGSGFVVEPGMIATNAHVVAGGDRVLVHVPDDPPLSGEVVAFDAVRDLALVAVPDLTRAPLSRATASLGIDAAVIGHPGGQRTARIAPARIEQRRDARGRDIFDAGPARRTVLVLASELQPGDSGAPVVDAGGQVVGVVFAVSPDRRTTAYALDNAELDALLAAPFTVTDAARCLAVAP